jgi:Flp pilus assembly protein TadD
VQAASRVSVHPDGWRCAVSGIFTGTWIVDARPLTDQLRKKRDAQNLVAHFVRLPLLKNEILDQIKKMNTISEPLRQEALTLATSLEPQSAVLAIAAWDIVQFADRSEDQYRRAYQWMEEANQVPLKDGTVLSVLGLALYRLGRFEEAITNLESAYKINTSGYYSEPLTDLICMAMAQHRLGRTEEARKTLAQSREGRGLVPPHLVREAEALIEGKTNEPTG